MTKYRTVPQHGQGSGLTAADLDVLRDLAQANGHLSDGAQVSLFEQEFRDHTGAEHAVAVTSCTMALELAGRVLGLGGGDEVISPALTFQATVASFVGSDVRVRFADVDPDTLCLDADSVARLIGPRTRAIYTVHYGGLCGDVARLRALADTHGLCPRRPAVQCRQGCQPALLHSAARPLSPRSRSPRPAIGRRCA